jgi:hypothetical protein
MTRAFVFFLCACAASLPFASAGAADVPGGNGPKQDVVGGTGTLVVPQPFLQAPQLHVNANNDPATGLARGHFYIRYTSPPLDLRGEAVCVGTDLLGHATVIGHVTSLTGNPPEGFPVVNGDFVKIRITDMGSPGTLDEANWDPLGGQAPLACPAQAGDLPISQGNYTVHNGVVPLDLLPALDLLLSEIETAAGD